MTDIYKPRFTNDASPDNHEPRVRMMDAASGEAAPVGVHSREDDRQKTCPSPTNTAPLTGGTCSKGELRLAALTHDSTGVGEQNSCRRSMGDASTRKDEVTGNGFVTSPTYTRQELVEVIASANRTVTKNGIQLSIPRSLLCAIAALDALVALGVVRVK